MADETQMSKMADDIERLLLGQNTILETNKSLMSANERLQQMYDSEKEHRNEATKKFEELLATTGEETDETEEITLFGDEYTIIVPKSKRDKVIAGATAFLRAGLNIK